MQEKTRKGKMKRQRRDRKRRRKEKGKIIRIRREHWGEAKEYGEEKLKRKRKENGK